MPQDQTDTTVATDFPTLAQLLREGQIDAVEQALATLPDEAFTTLPSRMLQVRFHLAKGDATKAVSLSTTHLQPAAERNPWVWQLMLQVFCAAGQMDQAKTLFQSGLAMSQTEAPDAVQAAVDQILDKIPDRKDQIAFLEAMLQANPDARPVRLRLASRQMLAGRPDIAAEHLRQSEAAGPLPAYAERMKSMLSPFLTSDYSKAFEQLRDTPELAAGTSLRLRRMARFASAAGRHDDAFLALSEAVDDRPDDWQLLYRMVRTMLSAEQRAALVDRLLEYRQSQGTDQSWDLQMAILLLQMGDADGARELLKPIHGNTAIGWSAQSLSAALDALGPDLSTLRDIPLDQEIVFLPKQGAIGTLIVFANPTGGMELLPFPYLDLLFADLPLNLIYLRDLSGLVFQNGLTSLGGGIEGLHAHLKQLTEGSTGPIATMGNSFAGHAATRAALAMGADHAISLAGIFVAPDQEDGILISQGLAELRSAGDIPDLIPDLRETTTLKVTHAFGADSKADVNRAHALHGVNSVTQIRVPDVSHHYTGTECIAQGIMPQILRPIFG